MVIDDVDIEMWPGEREQSSEFEIHANETFVKVVEQVRGRMDDEVIAYLAWSARTAGDWPCGLWELLLEVNTAGLSLPDELLDEAMESRDPDGAMDQAVAGLRARNRKLAPA